MNSLFSPPVDTLFVDDDPKEKELGVGFDRQVFKPKEWRTLRNFCNRFDIKQYHLNAVYKIYLTHEEVFVREFRVRTNDSRTPFLQKSLVLQELADIFIPMIYFKDYDGLEDPKSPEEISFARFIITSYLFSLSPFQDVIFDCFCILRQRFDLKLDAPMLMFNLKKMLELFVEDIEKNEVVKVLITFVNLLPDVEEIAIREILRFGVKFPIMFYILERFRRHFMREVLGDKFYAGRKILKSKLDISSPYFPYYKNAVQYRNAIRNESTALKYSCCSLISDIELLCENSSNDSSISWLELGRKIIFDDNMNQPTRKHVKLLSHNLVLHLKNIFGYKITKDLLVFSELSVDESLDSTFLSNDIDDPSAYADVRYYDNLIDRDFIYNIGSGKRSWVIKFFDENENIVREISHQFKAISSSHLHIDDQ